MFMLPKREQKKPSQYLRQLSIIYKGVPFWNYPITIQKSQNLKHRVVKRVVKSKNTLGVQPRMPLNKEFSPFKLSKYLFSKIVFFH